ncbi:MAG: LbtU family siderophore porin, partial [Gammaproteobacteria bacterium]|nr:LbtU family siderophore porin [Gammaproteobacteria bacterium]
TLSLLPLLTISAAYANDSINALQSQINALQNQINTLQAQTTPSAMVMSDQSNPFSGMPDTTFPLAMMQAKATFNAPLILGGELEIDPQIWGGSFSIPVDSSTTYNNGSDIAVTTADLNTMANMGQWVSAYISIQGGVASNPTTLDQAFLTFGNIQRNPFFLTIGETYLPFGVFNGNGPYANNLTTNALRASNTNQISLNYVKGDFYTNLAGFENKDDRNNLEDFSYMVSYTTTGNFNYSIGAGYLYDVRGTDTSLGNAYPNNNNETTKVNPVNTPNTITGSRNAVYDLNGLVAYGPYGMNGEAALTQSGAQNLNGTETGQMSTWNIAATYDILPWGIPTTLSMGYSATHNMNNIPFVLNGMANNSQSTQSSDNNAGMAHQWIAYMSNEFFHNIYMSPEFSYDTLYNGTHTWELTYDITANI